MESIITFGQPGKPIGLFSAEHNAALIFTAFFLLLFVIASKRLSESPRRKAYAFSLAILIAVQQTLLYIWYTAAGEWSLEITLPIQLCDLSIFLSIIALLLKDKLKDGRISKTRRTVSELLYFWGLGGATQAILTPDMGYYTFPHFIYYQFFLSHLLILLAGLYMILVEKYYPTFRSVVKTFVITNIYAAVIIPINYLINGNYLFLRYKPIGGSILDFLGPWPWYILELEGVAFLLFMILYAPFALIRLNKSRKKSTTQFPDQFAE
jgi:hypothetical integral membrane protein (TIGR02206 family)